MLAFAMSAILAFASNGADTYVAVPAGGDCAYVLMDMGYRGIPGDGAEQIWAPAKVVANVCS